MAGGSFILPITVQSTETTSVSATTDTTSSSGTTYSTILLLKSTDGVRLPGNDHTNLIYGFKNTGDAAWSSLKLVITGADGTDASSFKYASWPAATTAMEKSVTTNPGELAFVTFDIKAPALSGTYYAHFDLYANGKKLEGGDLKVPVTVTSNGVVSNTTDSNSSTNVSGLPDEPIVRVGLF